MHLNYDALRFWLEIIQLGATVLLGVYVWIVSRTRANKTAIDRVDRRVSELVRRVDVIDQELRAAPTHDDLGKLYDRLNTMNGQLQQIAGHLEAMARQFALINEHLLRDNKQ